MADTLKVFISATSGDLGTVREIVKQGLLTMRLLPVEQANFTPDYREIAAMLAARIGECDAVIHLAGLRYGAEPDPATLPPNRQRRSYAQMEADFARRLGKKLYVFVCPEDFPFDLCAPETEELAHLQQVYRQELSRRETLFTVVRDQNDVSQRVRELQLDLEKLQTRFVRHRRRTTAWAVAAGVVLAGVFSAVWWNSRQTPAVIRQTIETSLAAGESYDPARIKTNLERQIRKREAEEAAKLDVVRDWQKIDALEKARDQQLADVDRLIEQVGRAFEQKQASESFQRASQILSEGGVTEALRFLESKSESRESRIAALKLGLKLAERARAAEEDDLREVLRENLLTASLLEKNGQPEDAEAKFRQVVLHGGNWAEPRNALASFLCNLGNTTDPVRGKSMIHEAVALAEETLNLTSRTLAPKDWAETQHTLGNALSFQSGKATAKEARQSMVEAVRGLSAALEVFTRERYPREWARTQFDLGLALLGQGQDAVGEEGQRLREEGTNACRVALQVFTRNESPQTWAQIQCGLGQALVTQGKRAERAESLRLMDEAATAYRAALGVLTKSQAPQDWALAQHRLGYALAEKADFLQGEEQFRIFDEAIAAFRAALEVRTREGTPQAWARTQNILGFALWGQGRRKTGDERIRILQEAAAVIRGSLEIWSREQSPLAWAGAQCNLGNVLWSLGDFTAGSEGEQLLDESVACYRDALDIEEKEHVPFGWRINRDNLARALRTVATRSQGEKAERAKVEADEIEREAKSR